MTCKNCQNHLSDQSDYCYVCGGKVIRNRLTVKNLFEDFSATFLNYDNKFFQTFITLFKRPEAVIGSYIDGTRKKYVDVISYFAIALTISGLQTFIINHFFPEVMSMNYFGQQEEFSQTSLSSIQEYQSILFMIAVPIYAFISRMVFWKYKMINYTEHLVINMYLSAHFAIITAIVTLLTSLLGFNYMIIATLVVPAQIIYSAFAFKRILNLTMEAIILRTLKFFMFLFFVMIVYMAVFFSIMVFTGKFAEMVAAQKAARGN